MLAEGYWGTVHTQLKGHLERGCANAAWGPLCDALALQAATER